MVPKSFNSQLLKRKRHETILCKNHSTVFLKVKSYNVTITERCLVNTKLSTFDFKHSTWCVCVSDNKTFRIMLVSSSSAILGVIYLYISCERLNIFRNT